MACGREVGRDGSIRCVGSPIDFYPRKTGRCVRATLASDAVAAENGIEVALRHHSAITEISSGLVIDLRPNASGPIPLRAPFSGKGYVLRPGEIFLLGKRNATESGNVCRKQECGFHANASLFSQREIAPLFFPQHSTTMSGGAVYHATGEDVAPAIAHPECKPCPTTMVKVIALSDSANVFAAVSKWQPTSTDKFTAISLALIRDIVRHIDFSFLDACFDIADGPTKPNGRTALFLKLRVRRQFLISFVGRGEVGEMKDSTEQGGHREKVAKYLEGRVRGIWPIPHREALMRRENVLRPHSGIFVVSVRRAGCCPT